MKHRVFARGLDLGGVMLCFFLSSVPSFANELAPVENGLEPASKKMMGPTSQSSGSPDRETRSCKAIPSWFDEMNGFALSGIDPVAYLTHGAAKHGVRAYQAKWCHVDWVFHNENHRALFLRAPEFYQPLLSGYDAYGVAKGLLLRGNPHIWLRYKSRIFLFHNKNHLAAFIIKKDKISKTALKKWPALAKDHGLSTGYLVRKGE